MLCRRGVLIGVVVVMQDVDLAALRRQYPLPNGVTDTVMNRSQMSVAMGVSENTITKYIAKGMPVLTEGGNGKEYEFQISDCYAWKLWIDDEQRQQKAAADKTAMQLALEFRNSDDGNGGAPAGLTAKQIQEEAEADYKYQRAAEQRGELVRVSRVRELFEDTLVQFRTTITTVVDFAEMEFGLSPEQVEKLDVRCNQALIQARHKLEDVTGNSPDNVSSMVTTQNEMPV